MKKVMYLFACAMLAASVAGCGESPETQAADEIRAQVDVARRHFIRAAGLIGVMPAVKGDPEAGDEMIGPLGQGNPEALAALADAEKTLSAALTANAAATDAAKAPANSMLAEVRLAMAGYHGIVGRERAALTADLLGQIEAGATRVQVLAALDRALQDLAASTTATVEQTSALAAANAFLARVQARGASATEKVEKLTADNNALVRQIEQAVAATEVKRRTASDLRRQNRAAMGLAKLELDEKASKVEAEVEAGEARISTMQHQAGEIAAELALATNESDAVARQESALNDFIEGLRGRGADVAKYRGELAAMLTQAESTLTELSAALETQFADATAEFQRGLAACDRAAKANGQAIQVVKTQVVQAGKMKADSPTSPMTDLLGAMASRNRESGGMARKGDIAYAGGELARQLIQLQRRVERVADHVAAICQTAGVAEPAALKSAASSVAGLTLGTRADTDYGESADAFRNVADHLLTKKPVDIGGTKWLYQAAQARALLGRYRLLALLGRAGEGREYLVEAGRLVTSLLEGHEGDPAYLPVQQIAEAIKAEG